MKLQNLNNGDIFETTEDPRVLESKLILAKNLLVNIATNEPALLIKYNELNSRLADDTKEKQDAADAIAAAQVKAQKRIDALAKLSVEDKQILGLV